MGHGAAHVKSGISPFPMPSETFEQLLDRAAAAVRYRAGLLGHLGPLSPHQRRRPSRPFCAPWEWRPAAGGAGEIAGGAGAARVGAAGAARRGGGESRPAELPLGVPAESLGDTARASPYGAKTAQTIEFELNLWELPQTGSIEMDGRTWVRKRARLPVRAAAGLPRDHGEGGRRLPRPPATS